MLDTTQYTTPRRPRGLGVRRCAVSLLALALGPGCYMGTQRFPGVLEPTVDPLPRGTLELYEPGPEEALVVRHADSVFVRVAGSTVPRSLQFHDKRERVSAGSWVLTGSNGKVEVLLAGGARVELTGVGSGSIGSESRREPLFRLRDVSRATLSASETGELAQFELPGGARLATDAGPFVLERLGEDIVRLRNRSLGVGRVAYRDVLFDLAPGEVVDLALPPSGTAPFQRDPGFRTLPTDDRTPLEVRGEVEVLQAETGARLRATGPHEILAHGLVLRLDEGDEVFFHGLGGAAAPASEPPPPALVN
jgi:hypothetical protein